MLRTTWGRALGVPLACTEQGVGSIPTVSTVLIAQIGIR
jgi:hypothetical protein